MAVFSSGHVGQTSLHAQLLSSSPNQVAIAGWFADRSSSRRGPYLLGLLALAISTVALSVGRSTTILFFGRLVQGASSAIVHTVGMAILADTVGEAGVGPVMGFVSMSIALGVLLGPVVGGVLYDALGYVAVFVSAYLLIALDWALRVLMVIPEKAGKEATTRGADGEHSYGTFSPESMGLLDPLTPPSPSSSSSCASSTLPSSQPPPSPPRNAILTLLTTPRMLAAILADFIQSVALTGLETTLPLRIKLLFNYTSARVALIFLLLSLPSFAGPLIGHLSDTVGARIVMSLGFLLSGPLLLLLRFVDHDSSAQVAVLCVLLLGIGVALTMLSTPAFAEAAYVVADADAGVWGQDGAYAQAFGLMSIAYAAGSLVGPFAGALLMELVGWEGVTAGIGVVCLVCAGPVLWASGRRRGGGGTERVGVGDEGGDNI